MKRPPYLEPRRRTHEPYTTAFGCAAVRRQRPLPASIPKLLPSPQFWFLIINQAHRGHNTQVRRQIDNLICTAHCICSVISSVSTLNRLSSSLRLCFHIPLKRDQWHWDWRMRSNDTPNAIGCISESPNFHTSFHVCKRSPHHSKNLSRIVRDLEIQIFQVWSPPWVASESHKKRRCVREYLLWLPHLQIWFFTILVTKTRLREYLLRLLFLQIWLITILAIKKRWVRE